MAELCSKQFKKKPFELCSAVAALARKLNQKRVNPDYLRAFVAACLIPLDKDLGAGVRPIGIGEVLRRITSSATVTMLKPELIEHTAPLQTCAGVAVRRGALTILPLQLIYVAFSYHRPQ